MTLEDQLSELAETKLRLFRRMARRVVGDTSDAEDAVQDAFLSAYLNLDKFQGRSQLASWVGRIVINCSLMKVRRGKRKPPVSLEDLSVSRVPFTTPDFDARIDQERQHHLLLEAMPTLPLCYRRVIKLRVKGMKFTEIADKLGVNRGTVKAHFSRGKDQLARRLNP